MIMKGRRIRVTKPLVFARAGSAQAQTEGIMKALPEDIEVNSYRVRFTERIHGGYRADLYKKGELMETGIKIRKWSESVSDGTTLRLNCSDFPTAFIISYIDNSPKNPHD